jgi:hypothetical protein
VVSLNLRAAAESRPRKLTTESLPQLEDREPGRPYSLLTEISELKSQLEVSVYRRSLPVSRLRQTDYWQYHSFTHLSDFSIDRDLALRSNNFTYLLRFR